jgi:hypothetical protein
MSNKMQQKRGIRTALPATASPGELLLTLDTKEIFFGDAGGTTQPAHIDAANIIGLPKPHTYTHTQAVPASVWTITHDLTGKYPAVVVVDSAGSTVVGDIQYVPDSNQVILTFSAPFSGKAYCN